MKHTKLFAAALTGVLLLSGCSIKEPEEKEEEVTGEEITEYINSDLEEVIERGWEATILIYTTAEGDSYTVTDVNLIGDFMDAFLDLEVCENDTDLEIVDWNKVLLTGYVYGTDGISPSCEILLKDEYYFAEDGLMKILDTEELDEVISEITETGILSGAIDVDDFNNLRGYWAGDTLEIGIVQGIDGIYRLNFYPYDGNEDFEEPDIITINSLSRGLSTYTVTGTNLNGEEVTYEFVVSGGKLQFNGETFMPMCYE